MSRNLFESALIMSRTDCQRISPLINLGFSLVCYKNSLNYTLPLVQTYTLGSSSIGTSSHHGRIDGMNTSNEAKFLPLSSRIFFSILTELTYRIPPPNGTHGHKLSFPQSRVLFNLFSE